MLVVHLKRFSASGTWRRKLDTPVDFPLPNPNPNLNPNPKPEPDPNPHQVDFPLVGLDLGPYIMASRYSSAAASLPPMYDLVAVSNHFGSTGGGHYTAFAKHSEDGRWCAHGDSHASPLTPHPHPLTPTPSPSPSPLTPSPNPNQMPSFTKDA